MLSGIAPVIQLLDKTSDIKFVRLNRESGIDPYRFILPRKIYCSSLDELEVMSDDKFPVSFVLLERLIA